MTKYNLSYKKFNESSILIEWPSEINEAILNDIVSFLSSIESNEKLGVINTIQAYQSVLVQFNESKNLDAKIGLLKECYFSSKSISTSKQNQTWEIPVCYSTNLGIDLEELAEIKNTTPEKIIELHTQKTYKVYFTGFLPGFMYLGGLDKELHQPRKETPRLKIPKGSVAIGGNQTGIYPQESPGGWNIIGQTPINLFDSEKTPPCFISPGDQIMFKSISLNEFKTLKTLVEQDAFNSKLLLTDA